MPKTVNIRVGEILFSVPQVREGGVYPTALEYGMRSERELVGVMVEVNCETDFVARSESFRTFAHEIALQVAAASPLYIREEDIPADVMKHEKQIATNKAKEEGKPDAVIPRIVEGYLKKYLENFVLVKQPYIRDEALTIQEYLNQTIASIGENIVIRRMVRWALGETSEE